MAKIKIYGDIDSASIFFLNSTVDPKPMGTIIASLKSDEDRIVIQRTDRFEEDGVTFRTIFKRMNPSRICNKQGEELVDQLGYTTQQVIDYINEQANLSPNTSGGDGSGTDLIGQSVCFSLDATSTSILLDNGQHFGVNTIKAIENGGNIDIVSIDSNETITHFTNLEVGNACVNGAVVSGGLNDVINTLNELFTVGAFTAVVITDPDATTIADVNGETDLGTLVGNNVIDPLGDDILGTTATHNNASGYLSDNIIDQAGEYFTFDIAGKATYGFGLVHTQDSYDAGYYSGNASYADPSGFCVGANSSHLGYQFSHHFHVGNAHASWTNYGANTAYNMGEAWYDHNNRFDLKEEWNNGDPVKVQVGINTLGFITISTLADDGVNWRLHARSSYPVPQGSSFRLGVKLQTTGARLRTQPKVHLLEPAAPTMYFRYIESPDGNYDFPIFATEEEANYYDTVNGGSGESSSAVYPDDPTNTTWFIPVNGFTNDNASSPDGTEIFESNVISWTEITSLTDADLIPSAFTDTTITVDELSTVNYQLSPVDVGYVTTIGGIPSWSVINGTTLFGTAPEVTGDNVANPSDTTTVTVYRTNSYGTSQGTLTINITNLTPPATLPSGFTQIAGSFTDNGDGTYTVDNSSVVQVDLTLAEDKRIIIPSSWANTNVLPFLDHNTSESKAFFGIADLSPNWNDTPDLHSDFDAVVRWEAISSTQHKHSMSVGDLINANQNTVSSSTVSYWNYAIEWDGTKLHVLRSASLSDLQTKHRSEVSGLVISDEPASSRSGALPLVVATRSGGTMNLTTSGLSIVDIPSEPVVNLTNWNKALDFSGSNERAVQVSNNSTYNTLRMNGLASTAAAPSVSGNTSNSTYARAWATAIVFKSDRHNSNQHIWNSGEGASSGNDNIFLRQSSTGQLFFGWGREGSGYNEVYITTVNSSNWYGVYIGYNGARFNGSNATASNLSDTFDIRVMTNESGDNFNTVYSLGNLPGNWTNTGVRMDRGIGGDFTIGGRGSNRSFHGKIASMVITTLKRNVAMPTDAEVKLMITDPKKWEDDYLVGNTIRQAQYIGNVTYSPSNIYNGFGAVQIWLMGDGNNDSYSNMIRNQVYPSDQNWTKMNLISMVSNDIQNVNINGLS